MSYVSRNIVIFDLFGTLLHEDNHNWKLGLEYLINNTLKPTTFDEASKVAEQFSIQNMTNRSVTFKEAKMKDQLKLFKDSIGFKFDIDLDDVEFDFLVSSRDCHLIEGVKEFLKHLKSQQNEIYLMSNTIYSAKTIKRFIREYGLLDFFDEVFTSADFGFRKPSKAFFEHTHNLIERQFPETIDSKDIIFIGNSYEKDILGSLTMGYQPILFNTDNVDYKGVNLANYTILNSYDEIRSYIESNFLYMHSIANTYSMADGPGNRLVLYLQGCSVHCEGCHNTATWNMYNGKRIHINQLVIETLKRLNRHIRNITISGGEPLEQKTALANLVDILKDYSINVCLYTSYDFTNVPKSLKAKIDYVKTGKFLIDKRETTNGFFGSSNQKFYERRGKEWIEKKNI